MSMHAVSPSVERAIGICLGASTLSLVELSKRNGTVSIDKVVVEEHNGDPKGTFTKHMEGRNLQSTYVGITGRKFREITNFPCLIEPEATEIAYAHVNREKPPVDAVVSAGGETFIVYELDRKGRVSRISSGNKCASGTGEFFLQQIRRMNIGIDEAVNLSRQSTNPHHLSGRCSVFCKSDCTHALNKGESIVDVTAGLARMIAKKIEELLVRINARRVMIVGGTAQNDVVVDFVRRNLDHVDVPPEAPYFEALGSAIWALREKKKAPDLKNGIFRDVRSSFDFLRPLRDYVDYVDFKQLERGTAAAGDECILGLDVGSTTTKSVLVRLADNRILASRYLRTNGNPVDASRNCYRGLLDDLAGKPVGIVGLGVTGSGRYIAGLHAGTEGIVNEIIAHAKAAAYFNRSVDTIFEIGGQDAKYTYLTNGVASDYAMNEACSAGTGSFLEESAWETLGVRMEEIADIALRADRPPNFSDQCAAFISSDINTASQEGVSKEDIIAGLVYSICINYVNRVKGSRQVGSTVFMQGGVCYNKAVPVAMAALTGRRIVVPPEPGLMGAYGVALEIKNMLSVGLLARSDFNLNDLAGREVTYKKPFVCAGAAENCDRRCEISLIEIGGKNFPFGGVCNKYYNQLRRLQYKASEYNHVATRGEIMFERFAAPRADLPADAIVVGINRSFHVNTLYPFFFNFFNELGCRVVMPDDIRQSGIDKGMTSFCLSAQVALGMFEDLLDKKPDYIFMPQILEMHVSEQEEYRKEYQAVCMFVQGEPFYMQSTFLRDHPDPPKMLTPALNLMSGFDAEEETFVKIAVEMGRAAEEGRRAHRVAFEKQQACFAAMKEEGRRILADLEAHPDRTAVVLFGHSYNAFADETNKGVPSKFASRGIDIIPYDLLMYEVEDNYRDTYWEMGQRIIKAARIVERHPQLFGCYLTNFLCAIDSMMITHFRDLMGAKPSLTIEVDTHTADAGVNTRIEAFLDVVKNYLKVKDSIRVETRPFSAARIEVDSLGKVAYIDSEGGRCAVTDPGVKVVVPSMGDLFARSAAAVLSGLGWKAEALDVCDREALDLGRSVTTSKECLPIINIIGEVMKYLKYRGNPNEKLAVMMVAAGGCCRVGQYQILLQSIIEKLGLRDVALLPLSNDDGYAGLGLPFRLNIVKAVYAFDIMDDIRSAIKAMAADPAEGMRIFNEETNKILGVFAKTNRKSFYAQIRDSVRRLSSVALRAPIENAKYVGVVGEIFVRRDHFSLMGIPDLLASHGFVMLDAPVSEWVRYTDFLRDIKMYEAKHSLIGKLEAFVSTWVQDHHEKRLKRMFAKTGLFEPEMIDIRAYMRHSIHFFPLTLTGEPGLSSGSALHHFIDKYCGVINVGPFGCMNSRMTEAVATAEMTVEGKERAVREAGGEINLDDMKERTDVLPFLSIECDGNPFSQIIQARLETFLLQADRLAAEMNKRRGEPAGRITSAPGRSAPRRSGRKNPKRVA